MSTDNEILLEGRLTLAALVAAYRGLPKPRADISGPVDTAACFWQECDCGGEGPDGETLPGCGPGCPRGCWTGPLIWAAQKGDGSEIGVGLGIDATSGGLWGLTEVQMFRYMLPRWEAAGITPATQREAGMRDRAAAARQRETAQAW